MECTIYHNSRCSKSRQTLALLEEKGVEAKVVNYLDTPPTAAELTDILGKLAIEPQRLIRFKERVATELGIGPDDTRTEQEWIELMITNPILIERPIVISGDRAVIGRPPENVLDLV